MRTKVALLSIALQWYAGSVYSQRLNAPISAHNATIEQVLNQIEKSSGYVFLYNDKALNTHKTVSVNNKNGNITEILDHIFRGTNISYEVVDKQIILSVKKTDGKQGSTPFMLKGNVKDSQGEPLIGVSVKRKNGGSGAITDIDGNFSLAGERRHLARDFVCRLCAENRESVGQSSAFGGVGRRSTIAFRSGGNGIGHQARSQSSHL